MTDKDDDVHQNKDDRNDQDNDRNFGDMVEDHGDHVDAGMEEVLDLPDWFSFDFSRFDFRPGNSFTNDGLDFEKTFQNLDPLTTDTTILDEAALVKSIRLGERCMIIPDEAHDFYAKIKEHTSEESISLTTGLIKNSEQIKKLDDKCKSNILLKYFDLKLSSSPNFGKHPLLQKAASDHDAELKREFRKISLRTQIATQRARVEANEIVLDKLKRSQEDFLDFGRAQWVEI